MEDYEDDFPWNGSIPAYFAKYKSLNIEQLRGYFTWRTDLRNSHYKKPNDAFAYIYIFELMNQIGASSPLDALNKMKNFYLKLSAGDNEELRIANKLKEWILEFTVINGIDLNEIADYLDEKLQKNDQSFLILKSPNNYSDEAVFEALSFLTNDKIKSFATVKEKGAVHLFASLWRYASIHYKENKKNFFSTCFGSIHSHAWYPLEDAIYTLTPNVPKLYEINPVRRFVVKNGRWAEQFYSLTPPRKKQLTNLFQEADRLIRTYLGIKNKTKQKLENFWITPCFEAALQQERQAEIEAEKRKVKIHFSDLDKIRQDAGETRDSLLTEDEKMEVLPEENIKKDEIIGNFVPQINDISLNEKQLQVLHILLRGESVKKLLKTWHEMAEIFADSLNEALFDKIGDNAIECDGSELALVEDYRDDIKQWILNE